MEKYSITFIVPSIRPHLWKRYIESIKNSCTKRSWEAIFITPFDSDPLLHAENIKFIKSYRNPTGCFYEGLDASEGKYICNSVDDIVFEEGSVDKALDVLEADDIKKIMNFRYLEYVGGDGPEFDLSYWKAHTHPPLRLAGVPKDYDITLHFCLRKDLFYETGGIDIKYGYVNFGTHDFIFRAQARGCKVINSPVNVSKADHMPGITGDHKAIHDNDQADYHKFFTDYKYANILDVRKNLNFMGQYIDLPEVWDRRFNKDNLPTEYKDLL